MELKESLATSYEGVGLAEDALQQYYELETLFQHVSRERNFSWFGALVNPVPGDDSAPLLSISKKPYKDLILSNKISVFDFRIYILARQCELLAKIGSLSDVPRKVASFLGAFSKRLFEVEVGILHLSPGSCTYFLPGPFSEILCGIMDILVRYHSC